MHNGYIEGYESIRRELSLEVSPELFAGIRGSTDSELMFHLALTQETAGPAGGICRTGGRS